jgi:hypothetical protein
MTVHLHVEQFPHCCGIATISGFSPYTTLGDDGGLKTIDVTLAMVKEAIKFSQRKCCIAALNTRQIEKYEAMLLKCKFTQVGEFINPRTGNTVRTYQLIRAKVT